MGVPDLYIRWGFSEWKAGSGDVSGDVLDSFDIENGIAIKLVEGVQGSTTVLADSIFYTGQDGEDIQDLHDGGYLPNLSYILTNDLGHSFYVPLSDIWAGSLETLNNKDDDGDYIRYQLVTTAAQDEIVYKDGLPIWSTLTAGVEYEIELWGNNIQPTVSQINSTKLSRGGSWHQLMT